MQTQTEPAPDWVVYDSSGVYTLTVAPEGDSVMGDTRQGDGLAHAFDFPTGLAAPRGDGFGELGFVHKKIWGGVKKVGGWIKSGSNDPKTRDWIQAWLQERGAAGAASGKLCVDDRNCRALYLLDSASPSATAFRLAGTGECVGTAVVDSAQIPGWVSPCSAGGSFFGGPVQGAGVGVGIGSWFNQNQDLILLGGGGLLVLFVVSQVVSRRRKR